MSRRRPFRSRLGRSFAEYLALRRALGFKMSEQQKVLGNLDRVLIDRFPGATDLSVAILRTWTAHLAPQTRANRLGTIRVVCLFRRRTNQRAFVPDRARHRFLWPTRTSRPVPFIYRKEQVRELLRAAATMSEPRRAQGRSQVMFTALLLLYAAGLRLAEVAKLRVCDVDFAQGTLFIRDTKFFKSRIVPVTADVLRKLRDHVATLPKPRRKQAEQPLFQHRRGQYSSKTIGHLGADLLRACHLKPPAGRGGARLHDLRHSFAVHRITQWYADGEDVQSRLPLLATYMGHKDIASTQRYMTVTAEILGYAGRRYETACAPAEGR